MLGISTYWWHGRTQAGDEIVREALEMGYRGLELNYRMSGSTYQGVRSALNGNMDILSIHNYFPRPDDPRIENGSGDLFLLSSEDRDERTMAVDYSIRTIEQAHECECRAVVLHLGRVEMPSVTEQLKELFASGKTDSAEGRAFVAEQRRLRKSIHRKYLDNALFSLEKLNRRAEKMDVFLGIENRYHFNEIPDFDETGFILAEFKGSNLRYWHDMGHATVQENLGICDHMALLEAYSPDILGMHIHDVAGPEDHRAPGQGDIDFKAIRSFLNPQWVNIMEIHPEAPKEELMHGREIILEAFTKKKTP